MFVSVTYKFLTSRIRRLKGAKRLYVRSLLYPCINMWAYDIPKIWFADKLKKNSLLAICSVYEGHKGHIEPLRVTESYM